MPREGNDPRSHPTITRLEPLRPRGTRLRVHLDRGEPFEVLLEAVERAGLGVGDALPPPVRHHLLSADADLRVREAALNLLSYRVRTRAELARRLRAKGHPSPRIGPCLDDLERSGLLDDEAAASAFVRDRLRHRPRGPQRLTQELRAKGVKGDLAGRVVTDVLAAEEVTEADLARDVADGWVARQGSAMLEALVADARSPEQERARRRLNGYLGRRGFRGAALIQAVERAREMARIRLEEEQ